MKILFQGDSITDGNRYKSRASEWDKNHQIGHSYAYIVTGLLGLAFPERHYEFVNRGVSGSQTENLLAALGGEDALAPDPDVLSVLVGIKRLPVPRQRRASGIFPPLTTNAITGASSRCQKRKIPR